VEICTRVRQLREANGFSQSQLAVRVGISQPMLHYIESGLKLPSLALTVSLAKVLNCSIDELVSYTQSEAIN